eukprot:1151695-Pelagomonas_calceolata.AAC.6
MEATLLQVSASHAPPGKSAAAAQSCNTSIQSTVWNFCACLLGNAPATLVPSIILLVQPKQVY